MVVALTKPNVSEPKHWVTWFVMKSHKLLIFEWYKIVCSNQLISVLNSVLLVVQIDFKTLFSVFCKIFLNKLKMFHFCKYTRQVLYPIKSMISRGVNSPYIKFAHPPVWLVCPHPPLFMMALLKPLLSSLCSPKSYKYKNHEHALFIVSCPRCPKANLFARLFTCTQAKLTCHVFINTPTNTFEIVPRVWPIIRKI